MKEYSLADAKNIVSVFVPTVNAFVVFLPTNVVELALEFILCLLAVGVVPEVAVPAALFLFIRHVQVFEAGAAPLLNVTST
jgi:hypothetical protein